jgi:hypothetical protein
MRFQGAPHGAWFLPELAWFLPSPSRYLITNLTTPLFQIYICSDAVALRSYSPELYKSCGVCCLFYRILMGYYSFYSWVLTDLTGALGCFYLFLLSSRIYISGRYSSLFESVRYRARCKMRKPSGNISSQIHKAYTIARTMFWISISFMLLYHHYPIG